MAEEGCEGRVAIPPVVSADVTRQLLPSSCALRSVVDPLMFLVYPDPRICVILNYGSGSGKLNKYGTDRMLQDHFCWLLEFEKKL
jgi:hypothetical protein